MEHKVNGLSVCTMKKKKKNNRLQCSDSFFSFPYICGSHSLEWNHFSILIKPTKELSGRRQAIPKVFFLFIQLLFFYLLIGYFIYLHFQCYSWLLGFPSTTSLSLPSFSCFSEGASLPTHPLLPHCPNIPLCWGIRPRVSPPIDGR